MPTSQDVSSLAMSESGYDDHPGMTMFASGQTLSDVLQWLESKGIHGAGYRGKARAL
jgi:hypothetical protein